MNTEGGGGAPAPIMEQARPTLEMNRPAIGQQEFSVQMIGEEEAQLPILYNADTKSVGGIENALETWSYTIDDDPNYKAPEPAATIQLEEPPAPTLPENSNEAQFNPQMTSQQIDAEIARRGANAANAYDQLVYQYPDRAQELAASGNEQAAAAVARQAELARNPSTSTALETRSNQAPAPETKPTTEAGTGTELSQQLRQIQTTLVEVTTALDKLNNNETVAKEVKEITFGLADAVKLMLILIINSMDMDATSKLAAAQAIAGEKAPKPKKKETKLITVDTTNGPVEVPQLEDKGAELQPEEVQAEVKQLEDKTQQRVLELPSATQAATALPDNLMVEIPMLPAPVEAAVPVPAT